MENSIRINSSKLPIREYNGQRVVTFKDIDAVHGRPEGTARKRFNDNKKHFTKGFDYFKITPSEFRTAIGKMDNRQQNDVIVLAESGYLMLAKSFTDDLAWKVQRELVNNYFRGKTPEPEQLTLETSEYHYFHKTFKGEPVITLDDFEHFTEVSRNNVYRYVKRMCKPDVDYLHLKGAELFIYKTENRGVNKLSSEVIILKANAVRKLLKYFGLSVEIPMIEEKKPVALPASRREYVLKREPSKAMKSLIEHLHNEIKAIEGISYMLLCPDTKDNHENQREQLVKRIRALRDYSFDVSTILIE